MPWMPETWRPGGPGGPGGPGVLRKSTSTLWPGNWVIFWKGGRFERSPKKMDLNNKNCDLTIQNGDLTNKNGDLTNKNGDLMVI